MPLDAKEYWIAAWVGAVLQAVALVYLLSIGRWVGAATVGGFLVASLIGIMARQRLPELFALLFVIAALVNAAGWTWDLYTRVWGFDEIAHGYTMCTISLALAFLLHYAHGPEHAPGGVFVAMVAVLSLLLGIAWEIIEWLFDVIGTPWDTFTDLVADVIGGSIAGIFGAWAIRTKPPRQLRA